MAKQRRLQKNRVSRNALGPSAMNVAPRIRRLGSDVWTPEGALKFGSVVPETVSGSTRRRIQGEEAGEPFVCLESDPSFTPLPVVGGTRPQWVGAVLHFNGNIYAPGFNVGTILEIKPGSGPAANTEHVEIPMIAPFDVEPSKFTGWALAPNGCFYTTAFSASDVLKFNPWTGAQTVITGSGGGIERFYGATFSSVTRRIYGTPFGFNAVLIIDPDTDTATIDAVGVTGSRKWAGFIEGSDGYLYGAPYNKSTIFRYNPVDGTHTEITVPGMPGGNVKYVGGQSDATQDYIYFCPTSAGTRVLELHVPSLTPTFVGPTLTLPVTPNAKTIGADLGPNGRIYMYPSNINYVVEVIPSTNLSPAVVTELPTTLGDGTRKYFAGAPAQNGNLYGVGDTDGILVMDFGCTGSRNIDPLDPLYNKAL